MYIHVIAVFSFYKVNRQLFLSRKNVKLINYIITNKTFF